MATLHVCPTVFFPDMSSSGMKDTIGSKAPSMKFSKEDKKGQKKQDKEKNFPVEVKKEIIVDDS